LELHPAGSPDQDLAADTGAEQAAAAVRLPQRDADVGAVDRHLWERGGLEQPATAASASTPARLRTAGRDRPMLGTPAC
jgi:hypothetical protein